MSSTPEAPSETGPRVSPAWGFLLGFVVLLAFVEGLLTLTAPAPNHDALQDAEDVRALLAELAGPEDEDAQDPDPDEQRWLMLGDSVLVGNTGAAEQPNWASERLIDHIRSELSNEEPTRFEQVALDGMIPADMLALVEALDAADPEAEVSLLIELSPRHFSPSYAEDDALSRPWLAELERDHESVPGLIDEAGRWAPIYRHRERFDGLRETLTPPPPRQRKLETERLETEDSKRLAAFARLSVHYRESVLDPGSVQVAALVSLVERCRAAGRKVVFFTTPLEDRFAAKLRSESEWGAFLGHLDRLLEPDGRQVSLLPMDHPMFASAMFWDHVHLRPAGHRLLALNLLAQIGLRLERAPNSSELIARPGFDASLVARIGSGSSEGAAWQAHFDEPRAIALAPGARRVVIADTNNHVLRELHGDMRVVSTLVGVAGEPGKADGSRTEARLRSPRALAFVGDSLYIADGGGLRLRRLVDGQLETLETPDKTSWRIHAMRARADGEGLYTLEIHQNQSRIVHRGLDGKAVSVRVEAAEELRLSAFTLGPEGELYLACVDGSIRRLAAKSKARRIEDAEPVFVNTEDAQVIPQGNSKAHYPRPFAEVRLSQIVDLVYIEAYGGLLVQDYAPHPKRGKYKNHITERAHLRFLDLKRKLIAPWTKPLVVGFGYAYYNKGTGGFSSYFHEGAMALDPDTRALYYLESARSRLIRIEDGILGLAKTSAYAPKRHSFDSLIGVYTGAKVFDFYEPPVPVDPELRGTYEMLVLGSSLTSMSQSMGEFSLSRILIARIEDELLLRDRVRVHGFQRSIAGGPLAKQIKMIQSFEARSGRPDLILVGVNGSIFLDDEDDEAEEAKLLRRLIEIAERWDSKLVFFDTTPYIVRNREPLHPGPERMRAFLDKVAQRGFDVIRVGDLVLDDYLEAAPFAAPPGNGIHQPTWAIEVTAAALGDALVPIAREALRGREPAREREPPRKDERKARFLAEAFAKHSRDWDLALPALPEAAVQYSNVGDELTAFIDLGAVPEDRQEDHDALLLALLYDRSVRFSDASRRARVTIGRFEVYDEYGAGVEQGATIVSRHKITYARLSKIIERFGAAP